MTHRCTLLILSTALSSAIAFAMVYDGVERGSVGLCVAMVALGTAWTTSRLRSRSRLPRAIARDRARGGRLGS
jgi:hypothetical protein